jgi:hypothetical protein
MKTQIKTHNKYKTRAFIIIIIIIIIITIIVLTQIKVIVEK